MKRNGVAWRGAGRGRDYDRAERGSDEREKCGFETSKLVARTYAGQ